MEVWMVPCPHCGQLQSFTWDKIVFDSKRFLQGQREVTMVCEACGAVASEAKWKAQAQQGRYVAQHPERTTRGFLITGLSSTFHSWADIVQKFLEANEEKKRGNLEPLKSWTNTELGQTWETEGETMEADDLLARTETYAADVPEGVLFLTCGVDVQDDRFEFEIVGWGSGKENWGLGYHILYGDLKQQDVWDELDKQLLQTFRKADGTVLHIGCTCIDSGGHFTDEVYRFAKGKENRHVYAIHGLSGFEKPFIGRPTTGNRQKIKLFGIGVDVGKSLVMDRLLVAHPGPGYCHWSNDPELRYDEYYFRSLTAERRVITYRKGQAMYTWELKSKGFRRNEALDIRDYATAALEIANPVLDSRPERRKRVVGRRQRNNGI
jgi:phage terminase large subunit GpA-like protein